MKTNQSKLERIELRVSAAEKKLFTRAQKLSGDKSFSSFIARIVKKESEEIVANYEQILATERDREVFFEAVFSDQKPNENLVEAAKRYKSNIA